MDAKQKEDIVDALLKKASEATDGTQAVHFTQAACNAANAFRVIAEISSKN